MDDSDQSRTLLEAPGQPGRNVAQSGQLISSAPICPFWSSRYLINDQVLLITGNGDTAPDYFDEICGCALMVRHETIKIAVWTRDANNTLANLAIWSVCYHLTIRSLTMNVIIDSRFLKMHTGFAGIMWYERHSPSDTRHTKTKIRFNLPNQASH